jgi:hypothetical protein
MKAFVRSIARFAALIILGSSLLGCATRSSSVDTMGHMNAVGISYVRLVLALGEHDPDFVDAYFGPAGWREEIKSQKKPLEQIRAEAETLRAELESIDPGRDEMSKLRKTFLSKQLLALMTRADIVGGKKISFDEESRLLYDAVAPHHDAAYFQALLDTLEKELPGDGPLIDRIEAFRKGYVIPSDKLDAVFRAAIDGCRARTLQHLSLPPGESFTVEYVKNKPWSGYNWYKGDYKSVIQVNTDLPIFIDRAVDLACHEGYPGHHVYNMLLEQHMVKERGWMEFTVYPLFSPESLIAEGSANYGIEVAFPGEERTKFERDVLYPLAGLDPATAAKYARVQELAAKLSYAGNEAARDYLDARISREQARDWLVRYALMAPERAAQRVAFMEKYRSYVINYNLGKDLVGHYVERHGGTTDHPDQRWKIFSDLLSSPRIPSTLD